MSDQGTSTLVENLPYPRALVMGFDNEEGVALGEIFPFAGLSEGKPSVYEPDWDVFVSQGLDVHDLRRQCGISFGADSVQHVKPLPSDDPARDPRIATQRTFDIKRTPFVTAARDLAIPDRLSDELKDLIKRDLIPHFAERDNRRTYRVMTEGSPYYRAPIAPRWMVEPFVVASDGSILAGRVFRASNETGRSSVVWLLPSAIEQKADWVRLAWKQWSEVNPQSIPAPPTWMDEPAFYSAEEASIASQQRALNDERAACIARLDDASRKLDELMVQAKSQAAQGERGVLTEQGDALVRAVRQVLVGLGFEVDDMDAVWTPGDKREDLRVRPPGGDWEAVVEVRGYKRGASLQDLSRVNRFAGRYRDEKGKWPDGRWYIANSFIRSHPASRQSPLSSNAAEVASFGAEENGLVIDSVDLYRVWQAVGRDGMDAAVVRQALIEGRGRYVPSLGDA